MKARSWACATRRFNIEGVQFHPESVLTPEGPVLMGNFLKQRSGQASGMIMRETLEQLLDRKNLSEAAGVRAAGDA